MVLIRGRSTTKKVRQLEFRGHLQECCRETFKPALNNVQWHSLAKWLIRVFYAELDVCNRMLRFPILETDFSDTWGGLGCGNH